MAWFIVFAGRSIDARDKYTGLVLLCVLMCVRVGAGDFESGVTGNRERAERALRRVFWIVEG